MICLQMGKTYTAKTPPVILRSPQPRIHYYQNKCLQVKESQYLIPTYSCTLTPIPNSTCSVVKISHFQCTASSMWLTNRCKDPNTWLNHQLEKDVGCRVLQFITRWRSRSSLVTNPMVYKAQQLLLKKDGVGQILPLVTICMNKTLLHTCATVQTLTTLKIILIYVLGCEKRKPKYILMDWMKNSSEKLSFINLDR